jgi:hypothetical protein
MRPKASQKILSALAKESFIVKSQAKTPLYTLAQRGHNAFGHLRVSSFFIALILLA